MIALLSGHSLTVKSRFPAEKFALNLSERQSTATITVGPQAPAVSVDDWLRDEDDPGAGIVWRVKSVDYSYETDTRTLNCEHVINTLKDRLMFGEVTAGKITGNGKATTCTAAQAIRYILSYQSDWVLGSLSYSKSAAYSFNGDDLFSALETVSSSLLDPWWSYDLTVYPFRLNITDRESSVGCEMRMDRNIKTLRRTIDRSRMYTRFYPIGENDLHISGSYVQKNTDLYGVVCKVETDTSKKTEADLKAWANDRLSRHCEPSVTVTISGLDLSDATKESLDRIRLGLKCRVPLPEYETTIEEWVTKLSWSDKIADRESVTVTLANTLEDVASIVNSLSKSTSSGSRSAAKKAGEDHAWFVDTDTHVGMVAEAVAGPGADQDWSRVSSVFVDGEGIHQKVTKTQKGLKTAEARIDVTETSINQTVEAIGKDGKVTAASIVTAINNDKSEIRLNADRIYLSGTTTLNQTMKVSGEMLSVYKAATFGVGLGNTVVINKGIVSAYQISFNKAGSNQRILDWDKLGDMISKAELRGTGNNTLRLNRFNGSYLDFSRAITSWSASGGNGMVTVKAQPQNQSHAVELQINGAATITTNEDYTFRVYYYDDDAEEWKQTGANKTVEVSVFPNTKQLYCSDKSTGGGVTTYTFTYTSASSSDFLKGSSYKFHHNSGYT